MKKVSSVTYHEPVLPKEILDLLKVEEIAHLHSNAQFIDATLGYGGHSERFVRKGIKVLGIDTDKEALKVASRKLAEACPTPQETERCFITAHGNFKDLEKISKQNGFDNVYGILLDLGVSTPQLTSLNRGFSFSNPDANLDMRMDPETQSVTAADLLNSLPEKHLFNLFENYLDYKTSKYLAKKIVEIRINIPFRKVEDLLEVTKKIKSKKNLHSATLPFMALRIAVNTEIQNLLDALPQAITILKPTGRLAVISFHSGEDSVVKDFFINLSESGVGKIITDSPLQPTTDEIKKNPRARSAKLRVIEKI